jgi:hypothetical protein
MMITPGTPSSQANIYFIENLLSSEMSTCAGAVWWPVAACEFQTLLQSVPSGGAEGQSASNTFGHRSVS